MQTKDAYKIGTHTHRLWVRSWNPDRDDWTDNHHGEYQTYDLALEALMGQTGEAADITRIRWDEDIFKDDEFGTIRDAMAVDLERWHFYFDGKTWIFDDHEKLS